MYDILKALELERHWLHGRSHIHLISFSWFIALAMISSHMLTGIDESWHYSLLCPSRTMWSIKLYALNMIFPEEFCSQMSFISSEVYFLAYYDGGLSNLVSFSFSGSTDRLLYLLLLSSPPYSSDIMRLIDCFESCLFETGFVSQTKILLTLHPGCGIAGMCHSAYFWFWSNLASFLDKPDMVMIFYSSICLDPIYKYFWYMS